METKVLSNKQDDIDSDDPEIQFCLRGLYIDKITKVSFMKKQLKDAFKRIESKHYDKDTENFMIDLWDVFVGEDIDKLNKEIRKLKWKLKVFASQKKEQQIDDQMIEQAKNYPFENLIEVNKAKFGICPFHNEKTPSFYIKKNFGYCFGCNWGGDTIQFLMETENLSFIQAVKRLCQI